MAITIDIWDCCRQKLAVAQHSRCCASIVGGDTSKPLDPFPETMTLGPARASTDRWRAKSARPTMVGCPHRTARRAAPGDEITEGRVRRWQAIQGSVNRSWRGACGAC